MLAILYFVGTWLYENEFTVIFYNGEEYVLGKPLSERRDVEVSQTDLRVILSARKMISSNELWSRHDKQECDNRDQYSLFCALHRAQLDLTGRYVHRLPANQHVRFAIDDLYSSRWSIHRLTDFNAHGETAHKDVLHILDMAAQAIQNKLGEYRSEISD